MSQTTIFLILLIVIAFFSLFYIIKNKPDYLVLLGIRGLISYFLIQFVNYLCAAAKLSVIILANPVTLFVGAVLGFPGVLLLYLAKLYLS